MLAHQTDIKKVTLYIAEEQEILREVYKTLLSTTTAIELLQVSSNGDAAALRDAVSALRPDVLLRGIKKLDKNKIEELEQIIAEYPETGVVLLLVSCSANDIVMLRRVASNGKNGMAIFLKQSLDQTQQLVSLVIAAHQGQVILDTTLARLMFKEKLEHPLLKQLTPRELEILSLLSQGHTNSAIAGILFIDIKTVEHHLNSMYSKLKADADFGDKHPRVSVAKLYLETVSGYSIVLYPEKTLV